jgi:geranylgeranyl pyrophosphate synthase
MVLNITEPELLTILRFESDYWREPFRPALTSFSCEAVGGSIEQGTNAGVLFTLSTAGFGIHDDIIDNTSKKHFRRTISDKFGLNKALLTGDFLVLKASTMLQQITAEMEHENAKVVAEAYERCYREVCEAEFMALAYKENLNIDIELSKKMLWKSTADTEACGIIGSTVGNGSKQEVEALAKFGRRMGFYQRLIDDIKDCRNIEGNLAERLKNERVPVPILYAAKSSTDRYTEIDSVIQKAKITPNDARRLLQICFEADAFDYFLRIGEKNWLEANRNLQCLKPSFAQEMLKLMNDKSIVDLRSFCL